MGSGDTLNQRKSWSVVSAALLTTNLIACSSNSATPDATGNTTPDAHVTTPDAPVNTTPDAHVVTSSGAPVSVHIANSQLPAHAHARGGNLIDHLSSRWLAIPEGAPPPPQFFANSSSGSDVTSLKYIFYAMSMCTDVTINGSDFTLAPGAFCIPLYDAGLGSTMVDQTTFGDHTDVQIDLMDSTSLATFASKATANVVAGSYSYVIVNWSPAIGVTGSVDVDGTTLNPHACVDQVDANGLCLSSTLLTDGTPDEAVVQSANGGTWFKFQNPFVISNDDVTNATPYVVDLVFNPDGAISAMINAAANGGFNYGSLADGAGGVANTMYVPMIQLSPLPRKAAEVTSKETYDITQDNGDPNAITRVELYFQKSDSTKSIYGVNVITLLSNSTKTGATAIDVGAKTAGVTTDDLGLVTLLFTDGTTALVSGLARGSDSTVTLNAAGYVGTGTATFVGTTDVN